MEQLIQTLVERLIEETVRAVKAEDAINDVMAHLEETKKKLEDLQADYELTDGAYKYRGDKIDKLTAENDALKKEVEQLRAKLNSMEGLEAADRGLL